MIIAIDGYSSCGKSTLAKGLAKALDFVFIDSGAMYRAVTLYALQQNCINNPDKLIDSLDDIQISFKTIDNQQYTFLNSVNVELEIRSPEVAKYVSPISTIKEIRDHLVAQQKELGKHQNIVMDGRDIGTVVFPNAEYKFFVTAEIQIRAERRYAELMQKGIQTTIEDIIHNLTERDYIDSTRDIAPLKRAEDAILIDTTHISRTEQLNFALLHIQSKLETCK